MEISGSTESRELRSGIARAGEAYAIRALHKATQQNMDLARKVTELEKQIQLNNEYMDLMGTRIVDLEQQIASLKAG